MVGLDFNTKRFEQIFCKMQNGILDVFQTVQMIRRFRNIKKYNIYIKGKKRCGILPQLMRETSKMTDRDMSMTLELDYKIYVNFDPQTKAMLKDYLVCRNASLANYKELVFIYMELQGIKRVKTEVLDKKDIMESIIDIIGELVELDDKAEEKRINKEISSHPDQLYCIREYRKYGNVSVKMDHKTILALFLTTIVCEYNSKKVNVHETVELPMLLKQKLSKFKDDQLSDRVCTMLYSGRSEMDKYTVEDVVDAFKKKCKNDITVGGVMFNQKKNLHVYERLGRYSGIGMTYKKIVRRVMCVNDKKKQVGIPQVYILWNLGNMKLE